MQKKKLPYFYFFGIILILSGFTACKSEKNSETTEKLIEMDSMTYKYPKYVYNHIDSIDLKNASEYDSLYFDLIKIIAADKNEKPLVFADTIIDKIVAKFSKEPRHFPQNYLRALMYQGIIRYQSGISDNKAYEPIKEALSISMDAPKIESLQLRDEQVGFYYLGLIHTKNNNIAPAHDYFKQALFIGEILNDSSVLFNTYRDFYWNRMKALDFSTAKSILETLQNFPPQSDDEIRDVRNAEAAFYNIRKKYRNALQLDYELLKQDKLKNDKEAVLSDYFRISDNYKDLNQLDSALFYGELAVKNIVDTAYYLNYNYYLNVAEIAAKMNDNKKSSEAYSKVYLLMNKAITKELNTQILELEKKYDVSESERRAVNLKSDNMWLQFIITILAFIFVIITLIYRNKARIRKENEKSILQENKILEQEKQLADERAKQTALDKQLAERKLVEKQFVIPIYRQISQRNLDIKNFLIDLKGNPYVTKNPQILERIENEYKNYIQTTRISETQFLSDELFANLTGIKVDESRLFNESEKMMMAFIATGADNQQMATLFNTSVESLRVRKSKLKKKMEENEVQIPDNLKNDIE